MNDDKMELITTRICMVKDIGVHGNLFGGIMMSWIDEAASAMAVQVCHTPNMVTVKIEELLFREKGKNRVPNQNLRRSNCHRKIFYYP
jgi:acyl-CoA thioesterase YciA